ncbi:MAG: N-acetylmuramic acid 6-phosphate etherase [Alphaproteobacteria bacterium]|nr:N-acetylmuramic acid 6-phosphate etherase [Alphaproteobacteria bacterium]
MRKTEEFAEIYRDLEIRSDTEIATLILNAQDDGLAAVRAALPCLTAAAQASAARLQKNSDGRIIYAGAGTSIRLGVQDGVELVPTFGWTHARLGYLIAGGANALTQTMEGAEDDAAQAGRDAKAIKIGSADICISLSASGSTPYALGACEAARTAGAICIGIANNPDAPLLAAAEYPILLDSGPEPIRGSTRMTAGTAQKVTLNLLSTLIMIRLNRIYRGMMVDVIASSQKLHDRAARIVMAASGVDEAAARAALNASGNAVKPAILVAHGQKMTDAVALLEAHDGNLRTALATLSNSRREEENTKQV